MITKSPKIIVDVDDTLTIHNSFIDYREKLPRVEVINKLREYKQMGFEIILFTARNMYTHQGDLNKISMETAPILEEWLLNNDVPFDQLIFGKPWCGEGGFYIDDKAIRPSEFVEYSFDEIKRVLKCG